MIFIFRKKYDVSLKVYKILRSIYGIGINKTREKLVRLGVTERATLFNLRRFRGLKLNSNLNLEKDEISEELKNKEIDVHLIRLIIGTYKGVRLNLALPVNGQRTKSNARTSKRLNKTNKGLLHFVRLKLIDIVKAQNG